MKRPRRIAAIDLGTNTTLMLVAEIDAANAFKVLEDRATITRLGRGVDQTRQLDAAAIARTLEALRAYADTAKRWDASVVAVGTSALRDAANRDAFLAPAAAIVGCRIHAIDGAREAELTFRGALEGIDAGSEPITVVDVGGGSTEIIVGAQGAVAERVSLNFGSVRLHERYQLTAPVTGVQADAVRNDVRLQLTSLGMVPAPRVVAVAGTATTLASMALGVGSYDPVRVHGQRLTRAQLGVQLNRLLRSSIAERQGMVGLLPERADVIAAGALILDELMSWSGANEFVVSDGGVRFGLAREALGQNCAD